MIKINEKTAVVEFSKDLNDADICLGYRGDMSLEFRSLKKRNLQVGTAKVEDSDIYRDTVVTLQFHNPESVRVVMEGLVRVLAKMGVRGKIKIKI